MTKTVNKETGVETYWVSLDGVRYGVSYFMGKPVHILDTYGSSIHPPLETSVKLVQLTGAPGLEARVCRLEKMLEAMRVELGIYADPGRR